MKQLAIRKHFVRCSSQRSQLFNEFRFRQVVNMFPFACDPWRPTAGNKKAYRLGCVRCLQSAKQFEAHKSAHAVAEESERPVEVRRDCRNNDIHQCAQAPSGRLRSPQAAPRIFDRPYVGAQPFRPGAEDRGGAARIRKAEQPGLGGSIGPIIDEPGRAQLSSPRLLTSCCKLAIAKSQDPVGNMFVAVVVSDDDH